MPGLNTIVRFSQDMETMSGKLDDILKKMAIDSSYSSKTMFSSPGIRIMFSGYEGYPRHKIDCGDKTIIVEGAFYNKTIEQVRDELLKILPGIVDGTGKTDRVADFMFNTDGEFIVYYIDNPTSTMVIFNDALGRLPAYYHSDDKGFILGRAMKFVTGNLPQVVPDDHALIEYFLFSAPLANRTFFKDIYRLMPCSLFVVNLKTGQARKQTLHTYNFDDRLDDRPISDYVSDLHDLFVDGVTSRASYFRDRKQVVALSGGLDSRAILMAMLKSKIDVQTITFLDHCNLLARDQPVVDTLVKMYNLDHKRFNLIEENIPYFERMVFVKDGTVMMGTMGSVLNSMEIIEREYGKNIVYYVGDEGNYTTAPRYGGGKISSTPELVKQILLKNSLSVFTIDEVARIFEKTPRAVTDYLCDYFSTYPEKDNVHKVDHYFFWERSFKFTMEGQDRVRLFFWPLAPHYATRYVTYALKIKNKYLAGWKVYAGLLRALDERCVSVKYSNFGIALDSPLMPFYLPLRAFATSNEKMRRTALVLLRLLKNPASIGRKTAEFGFVDKMMAYVLDLVARDEFVRSVVNVDHLRDILSSEKYLFRAYAAGNLVKYLTMVDNKQKASS